MASNGWRSFVAQLGWLDWAFLVSFLLAAGLQLAGIGGALSAAMTVLAFILGVITVFRWGVRLTRRSIWRLRNRLVVAYVFIAVVPILLLLTLFGLGATALSGQIGAYLVQGELEARVQGLRNAARGLASLPPQIRPRAIERVAAEFRDRYPGLVVLSQEEGRLTKSPEDVNLSPPHQGITGGGIASVDAHFYLWAHEKGRDGEVTLLAPLSRSLLRGLVPRLGDVTIRGFLPPGPNGEVRPIRIYTGGTPEASAVPPASNPLDGEIVWGLPLEISLWDQQGKVQNGVLGVRTRMSAVLDLLFTQREMSERRYLLDFLIATAIVFLIVEFIAAYIGITLTRTITGAVHSIYEGTQKVKAGDLGHRIEVSGRDQLGELGSSFNSMTQNLERLLDSEKERQRLQAELEIAREVQSQLHPREVPTVGALRLSSLCNAARMVSGDYFDYQALGESRVALAIGDVAGKGISAALLMATLQSALRSQLRQCLETAAIQGNGSIGVPVSTARLVSNLNQQLYASTSPEKYATFFLTVYDEPTGSLTYTNAGHLSPVLIRRTEVIPLDSNGTVVGAFPFASYGESKVDMHPGDLLVCYTDGITEPENEYGEMFGEERLFELLVDNAHLPDQEILNSIADAIARWTATPELQDDMTLLLARRT